MNKRALLGLWLLALMCGSLGAYWWLQHNVVWCAWLGMVVLAYAINNLGLKQVIWIALSYGLPVYFVGLSWLYDFDAPISSDPALVAKADKRFDILYVLYTLIIIYQFMMAIMLPALLSFLLVRRTKLSKNLVIPAVFTLFEYARARMFGGFPLGQIGYGFIDSPLQVVLPWLGVLGLTFVAWLFAVLLVDVVRQWIIRYILAPSTISPARVADAGKASLEPPSLGLLIITTFLGFLLAPIFMPPTDLLGPPDQVPDTSLSKSPLPIRIVHERVTLIEKENPYGARKRFKELKKLTGEPPTQSLVLWPEGSVTTGNRLFANTLNLARDLMENQVELLFGAYASVHGKEYNAVLRGRDLATVYQKRHLVPFSEYLPDGFFASLFANRLDNLSSNKLSRGEDWQEDIEVFGMRLRPLICYEIMFGHEHNINTNHFDAFVYFNDLSWVRDSVWLPQSIQMARARALEYARPVIAVGNMGFSGYISATGDSGQLYYETAAKVIDITLPPLQRAKQSSQPQPVLSQTWYSRWGDRTMLILLTLIFIMSFLSPLRLRGRQD